MKKVVLSSILFLGVLGLICPQPVLAYNFGDFRSVTLVGKAWDALSKNDMDAVLAYTNKCLELYTAQAKKMQDSLQAYPEGEKDKIFGFWALNDVSTALFIQGEAYRNAKMTDEARQVYQKLIKEFTYGQAWDTKGWFWKPAEAAKEKLAMLEDSSAVDFGDQSSSFLVGQAWKALNSDPDPKIALKNVITYADKVLQLYTEKAKEQQASLTDFPWESKEKIFSYWALNDVGTALYVKGEAYKKAGMVNEARESYKKLVKEFSYAQCWDPQGWFWKPSEAAQQSIDELGG